MCGDTEFKWTCKNCSQQVVKPDPIRGGGGKPLPSDESNHGTYSPVGQLYWNLIHAFSPETHTRSRGNSHMCAHTRAHAHTHRAQIPTHIVAKQYET